MTNTVDIFEFSSQVDKFHQFEMTLISTPEEDKEEISSSIDKCVKIWSSTNALCSKEHREHFAVNFPFLDATCASKDAYVRTYNKKKEGTYN